MMKIPDDVRETIVTRIASAADQQRWMNLSLQEKADLYVEWARDPYIGGVLQDFMGTNEIHRYLKDSIIKNYARDKMEDPSIVLLALGIPSDVPIVKTYIKPHTIMLDDRRIISWSSADQWKSTVLAVYERSRAAKRSTPFAAVLFNAEGKFSDGQVRAMVEDVAKRLDVVRIAWLPA